MLKCICNRCHTEMKVPLSATPFIMPDPNETKPEFIIFQHIGNNQMEQLYLCPECEKAFKSFLNEHDVKCVEEKIIKGDYLMPTWEWIMWCLLFFFGGFVLGRTTKSN